MRDCFVAYDHSVNNTSRLRVKDEVGKDRSWEELQILGLGVGTFFHISDTHEKIILQTCYNHNVISLCR